MTKTLFTAVTFAALASAQAPQGPRASPHETISVTLGGKEIKIEYGRHQLMPLHLADTGHTGVMLSCFFMTLRQSNRIGLDIDKPKRIAGMDPFAKLLETSFVK